jgi:uncharacterized secreted protein with C-terminal beta-propeller domain
MIDGPVSIMEKRVAAEMEVSMLAPGEIRDCAGSISSPVGRTDIIAALPAESMVSKIGSLGRSGEMLLSGETLVVFDACRAGISSPIDISDNGRIRKSNGMIRRGDSTELVAARKYGNTLYLVEKTWANESLPCPIIPFSLGSERVSIRLYGYLPTDRPVGSGCVFTALSLRCRQRGKRSEKTSFVGSSGQSTVYMSENAIYATYPKRAI